MEEESLFDKLRRQKREAELGKSRLLSENFIEDPLKSFEAHTRSMPPPAFQDKREGEAAPQRKESFGPMEGAVTYSITDVAKKINVPPHTIRFWETRFYFVAPQKNTSGHRFYTEKDLEVLEAIKLFIVDQGQSISFIQKYVSHHGVESLIKAMRDPMRIGLSAPDGAEGVLSFRNIQTLRELRNLLLKMRQNIKS